MPLTVIIINSENTVEDTRSMTKKAIEYINKRAPKGIRVRLKRIKRLDMEQEGNTLSQFTNLKRYFAAAKYVRRNFKECRGNRNTCMIMDGLMLYDGANSATFTNPIYYIGGRAVVCAPTTSYRIIWSGVGNGNAATRDKAEIVLAHEILHSMGSWHVNDLKFKNGQTEYRTNVMNSNSLLYGLPLNKIPMASLTKYWIKGCYDYARNELGYAHIKPTKMVRGKIRHRATCDIHPDMDFSEHQGH